MFIIFRQFLVISYFAFVHAERSALYEASKVGFQNWTLYHAHQGYTLEEFGHESTDQLDVAINQTEYEGVRAISPIIDIRPAWKFFVKLTILSNGVPVRTRDLCPNVHACAQISIMLGSTKESLNGIRNQPQDLQHNFTNHEFESGYLYNTEPGVPFVRINVQIISFGDVLKTFNITELVVLYDHCPETVQRLARYPNIPASQHEDRRIETKGECIENAILDNPQDHLLRFCDHQAKASFFGSCICSAGYEDVLNKCQECRGGYFRKSITSPKCSKCGQNTDVLPGRIFCQCKQTPIRYHRFQHEKGRSEKPCYAYPSQPRDVANQASNETIFFSWGKPSFTGDRPINYSIRCLPRENKPCLTLNGKPLETFSTLSLDYVITDLMPYVEYTFEVCSRNDVSLSNAEKGDCQEKTIRTLEGTPTAARNLLLEMNGRFLVVRWHRPFSTGAKGIRYRVKCGDIERLEDGVHLGGAVKDILIVNIDLGVEVKPGEISCEVTGISSLSKEGATVFKAITVPASSDSSGASGETIAGGIIGGIVFLVLLILCIAVIYRKWRERNEVLKAALNTIKLMEGGSEPQMHCRRELEQRMRNIYVPLQVLLNQNVVDLEQEEPIYEEIPISGYNYPYRKLKKVQELGQGNFARVSQCEADDICGRPGKTLVAVKQLKDDIKITDEKDFEDELELMKELKGCKNVIRLLGACSYPRCMIVEYLPGGDLLSFMLKSRQYRAQTEGEELSPTGGGEHQKTLEEMEEANPYATAYTAEASDLMTFAMQIANGMQYVADLNIVHRDLACRNILVGYNRVCKVADFGLAKKVGDNGIYQRTEQAKLPVKWLPPESIKYGRSSLQSDIWSYGIMMWEIVTIGAVPYPGHKSKEIPALLNKGYRMEKPLHCKEELYELMLQCWSEDEKKRPNFKFIHQKLERMIEGLSTYINLEAYSDDSYLTFGAGDEILDEDEMIDIEDE
ncbi:ephrin type-A receptor 4-B-like isoform X2 [Clytia hemisphaerica]|uniref:ephrin type-A receptor 4-B-like isoform X2 n=1 Tax=Clytia hemisphaerica TaxID=252671 RepID=UPI0034D63256